MEREASSRRHRRTLDRVAPACWCQHGVVIMRVGGFGVDLRHDGRVTAGGGLLVRESTLFLPRAE